MTSRKTMAQIADYFNNSSQWKELMRIMRKQDESVNHVHIYVDTNLNPWCMEQLVKNYFAKIGHPVERKIEIFTSGQIMGSGTIHGVEPKGLPHFDMIFRYTEDAPIQATDTCDPNVEFWGDAYMEKFHAQYPFKTELSDAEKTQVETYFESKAWQDYCRLNESEDVVHIHANVETSIHPMIIREYALKAMAKRGWKIEYSVPVAFKMRGLIHGKVVFAGLNPEKMFDIAWGYNPTVILVPSSKYWLTTDNPTYDARTMNEIPVLLKKNNFRLMSLAEIEETTALINI